MRSCLKYLGIFLRHKWYVFIECRKAGIPIRGLAHDLSKLWPDEFFVYARHFANREKPDDSDRAFDAVKHLHKKRNRHHWEWWTAPNSDGTTKTYPMDHASRMEMVCDWYGAAKAYNGAPVLDWYRKKRKKIFLHPETRAWVEAEIGFEESGV